MTTRVEWHGEQWLREDLEPAVDLGLSRVGVVLEAEMRKRQGSEGGGVTGKTKKGRNKYRAAPPGAFPGVRTGTLRRSFGWNLLGELSGRSAFIRAVRVGTNIVYGRHLQYGTSRMAARPWAMRSVKLAEARMNREFAKTVARSLAANARRRAT